MWRPVPSTCCWTRAFTTTLTIPQAPLCLRPPIREKANQEVLWRGLRRGDIQTISTDHCSFTLAQKDAGREDFTKIPGGLPGVETRGELIYSYGVAKRKLSLAQMCRVLSENPAKLYGLYPRKGVRPRQRRRHRGLRSR